MAEKTVEEQLQEAKAALAEEQNNAAELSKKLAALEEQNAKKDFIIEKLSEQLDGYTRGSVVVANEEKKVEIPKDAVEVDGKEYVFKKPRFHVNGKDYVSSEAAFDEAILRAVLAIKGQTILEELA